MVNDDYINILNRALETSVIRDARGLQFSGYSEGIAALISLLTSHKQRESHIYFIGNGGSSAIASHMTADYMKNGGFLTFSLYDNALTTCMGNDYGYEYIFSRPLSFLLREGDLLVAISSSGNSPSITNAAQIVLERGADLISLTGFSGDNRLRSMGGFNIYVPSNQYGIVECAHTIILQQAVDTIAARDGIRL